MIRVKKMFLINIFSFEDCILDFMAVLQFKRYNILEPDMMY